MKPSLAMRLIWLNAVIIVAFLVTPAIAQNAQPNIILINLDDADSQMLSQDMLDLFYPAIGNLSRRAIRFTNAHATTPFCAPSRVALMRGQYAFNTGIKVNDPDSFHANGFTGSYTEFLARNYENDVLSVWMKNAGYRTIHIGKYHHKNFDFQVPPGWDDFVVNAGARYYSTTRFTNRDDPDGVRYNTGPDNYIVDLDAADAACFLESHLAANPDQPFFLYLAPLVPHRPVSSLPVTAMVKTEYADTPVPKFPMSPNFNEKDMSDKPPHLQGIPPFALNQIDDLVVEFESRARAMKSVDDMVATVTSALPQQVLDNTWIFVTSDNGYQLGQHRLKAKLSPYDATTRVPLLVKGPGTSAIEANHLLAHIDICPTILELAGAPIPAFVDAKSFQPLLENPQAYNAPDWQTEIMIENWSQKFTSGFFSDFAYTGLRMHESVFVNWSSGAKEFYDLSVDPFQLENAFELLDVLDQVELAERLGTFRTHPKDPITTITSPGVAYILPRELLIEGYCEDDRGVDHVLTTIQSSTTGRYWNGNNWQSRPIELQDDPLASNQLISQWSRAETIDADASNGLDVLWVTSRSKDVDGNLAVVADRAELLIDSQEPIATYAANLKDGTEFIEGEVKLNGFYRDNFNVRQVNVIVIDLITSMYWNGTTFQTDWVSDTAKLVKGRWLADPKLPPGVYESQIQPIDEAGNLPMPQSFFFGVKSWR